MEFLTSYYWESGIQKKKNQDSICLQHVITKKGDVLAACVCDGLGGLEEGEVASGYAVECIAKWFYREFMKCVGRGAGKREIQRAGQRLFTDINRGLFEYGKEKQIAIGTTATLLVIWGKKYCIFHIGDSRIYLMKRKVSQLTEDHAVNEHTLTKCLGMNENGRADCLSGKIGKKSRFLLCSDGFRHYIDTNTLHKVFIEKTITDETEAYIRLQEIGKRNMERGERDNISAIYIQ